MVKQRIARSPNSAEPIPLWENQYWLPKPAKLPVIFRHPIFRGLVRYRAASPCADLNLFSNATRESGLNAADRLFPFEETAELLAVSGEGAAVALSAAGFARSAGAGLGGSPTVAEVSPAHIREDKKSRKLTSARRNDRGKSQ